MTKFVKKVLLFFVLIALIDIASGFGFNYLRSHAKGGDTQKNYYISEQCCDDILILGSSRAARHYDPQVLEDSLHMSCYNCGEPGCGIITAFARYGMIEQRHKPKLVIYEISPLYDYFILDDNSKYLGRVRQYANKPPVRQMFIELGDELESVRLWSNMYLNNSFIFHNVLDNVMSDGNGNGFKPLHGIIKSDAQEGARVNNYWQTDSVKLSYIENLIIKFQKDSVGLCFMVSPRYISEENARKQDSDYVTLACLCDKYGIPFINHTYMEGISNKHEFFQDFGHMNKDGAKRYSEAIVADLKQYVTMLNN